MSQVPQQKTKPITAKNFEDFTIDALITLGDRNGSSRPSLVNYISKTHATDLIRKVVNSRLKRAITNLISLNKVKQVGEGEGFNPKTRFKLEKNFRIKVMREMKKKEKQTEENDTTPKKVVPKKSSTKKEKPKDVIKQAKKTTTPKKRAEPKSTPKKAVASKSTPKKAVASKSTPKKATGRAATAAAKKSK